MKNRAWNRLYANMLGFFWVPCPSCGKEFGGHEWVTESEHKSSLALGGGKGAAICPECTMDGAGDRSWAKLDNARPVVIDWYQQQNRRNN